MKKNITCLLILIMIAQVLVHTKAEAATNPYEGKVLSTISKKGYIITKEDTTLETSRF